MNNLNYFMKAPAHSFRYLLVFFICLFFNLAHLAAQSPEDSLCISQVKWQEKTIKPGIVWKQAHFTDLFNSQQEINLVEIDLNQKKIHLAFRGFADSLQLTSTLAKDAHALVALNGAFFDTKNGGGTTFLRQDGKIINGTTLLDKNGKRTERSNSALLLKGKKTNILMGNNRNIEWDKNVKVKDVLVCGPMLIQAGSIVALSSDAFNENRHPRSAVAIRSDKKLILLTVDGRNAQAQGMSLPELAYFLHIYGAKEAFNLDGGGSTTLYIQGQTPNGVVNYPSDNKLFDHEGERKVANVLLVY